jgi:hypothetical protein
MPSSLAELRALAGDPLPLVTPVLLKTGRWIANYQAEQTMFDTGWPMGPWRAPGSCVFSWVFHSFIDEDPLCIFILLKVMSFLAITAYLV